MCKNSTQERSRPEGVPKDETLCVYCADDVLRQHDLANARLILGSVLSDYQEAKQR